MEAGDGGHDNGRRVDLRTPGILETVIQRKARWQCRGREEQAQVEEQVED